MANYSASGMGGPLQPRPPAPAAPAPMNMTVSAEKRSKLKSYMEGYKDAIESKTAEQLLPNISPLSAPAAMPPMQRPVQQAMPPAMSQPPMMMNMGGMVDVFDPNFMNNLGSEIMDSNEDSIVQGFRNGGFTTNINVGKGSSIGGRPEEKEEKIYSGDPAIFGLGTVTPDSGSDYTPIQDSVPSQTFEPVNTPVVIPSDDPYQRTDGDPYLANLTNPVGSAIAQKLIDDANLQQMTQDYEMAYAPKSSDAANFSDFMSGNVDRIPSGDIDDLGSATPIFKTVGEGKSPVSGNVYDAYTSPSLSLADIDLTNVKDSRNPKQGTFKDLRDEINAMSDFEKGVGSFFAKLFGHGVDDQGVITPAGLLSLRNQTQATMSRNQQLEDQRRKDQEREERRLAEEQRLRELIESMLPPKDDTIGTGPIGDIDVPLPDPGPIIPETPISPVVESTRVPGFNLANLPAFPQFNMPTQPVLPPIIQPNIFNQLLSNMKMPVAAMQEGGNVKSLDTAVENFIEAIK